MGKCGNRHEVMLRSSGCKVMCFVLDLNILGLHVSFFMLIDGLL